MAHRNLTISVFDIMNPVGHFCVGLFAAFVSRTSFQWFDFLFVLV